METKKKNGRPLKAEGRRTLFIKARVNEEEHKLLKQSWTGLGIKESDFLRKSLLKPNSASIAINVGLLLKRLDHLGAEIGRSGNNINQLARHANFLNKRGMLDGALVDQFNSLFTTYISQFRTMEKTIRELIRLLRT